jgi:hypothetical protein
VGAEERVEEDLLSELLHKILNTSERFIIVKAYNLNLLKSHLNKNMRPTMNAPRATKTKTMPKFCRMLSDS